MEMVIGYSDEPRYFLLVLTGIYLTIQFGAVSGILLATRKQRAFGWGSFVPTMGASSLKALTWNSPLQATGMDQRSKTFLIIGETKASRRDTTRLAAGRVH